MKIIFPVTKTILSTIAIKGMSSETIQKSIKINFTWSSPTPSDSSFVDSSISSNHSSGRDHNNFFGSSNNEIELDSDKKTKKFDERPSFGSFERSTLFTYEMNKYYLKEHILLIITIFLIYSTFISPFDEFISIFFLSPKIFSSFLDDYFLLFWMMFVFGQRKTSSYTINFQKIKNDSTTSTE